MIVLYLLFIHYGEMMKDEQSQNQSKKRLNADRDTSESQRSLNMPFDSCFRAYLSHHQVRVEFCQVHLPYKLSSQFDYDSLKLIETSFVDESLRQYASDLVFEVKLKNTQYPLKDTNTKGKAGNKKRVSNKYKVALLIEHQSTPDKNMAIRVHHYMMNIFISQLKQQKSKHQKLTPVYPIIFYNGDTPYPYSLDIHDCFDDPLAIMPDVFAKEIPIIDVNLLDDDELKKQRLLGILTRALKYRNEMQWTKVGLIALVNDLHSLLANVHDNEFRALFRPLINYLSAIVGEGKLAQAIVENTKIPNTIKGEFMTAYEFYTQKGIEQGEVIGFEKGEYQKSVDVVRQCLRKGFDFQTIADLTELELATIKMLAEQMRAE